MVPCCFGRNGLPVDVTFESGSEMTNIGEETFAHSSNLLSIYIPSNIEILCGGCFSRCEQPSEVTFESGSRLTQIDPFAFLDCSSLSSICIPSTGKIWCETLSVVTFERDCQLSRIETFAFDRCFSLESICIPVSVEIICKKCFAECQELSTVSFASNCSHTSCSSGRRPCGVHKVDSCRSTPRMLTSANIQLRFAGPKRPG
jgi:hypothetical protein